jgi:Zn-dependent M28 family amino/carboxypeptidase
MGFPLLKIAGLSIHGRRIKPVKKQIPLRSDLKINLPILTFPDFIGVMSLRFIIKIVDSLHTNRRIISRVKETVKTLSVQIGERSAASYDRLESAKDYIVTRFTEYGADPSLETFKVGERFYTNIIVEIPGKKKFRDEIIIVGAHYDTVEGSAGANDNATGIAGLIELYRVLSQTSPKRTIRLIAFSLEEPPFFGSENMGSMVYAAQCAKRHDKILLMICLDMLGFGGIFVKQEYPFEEMKERYPSTGDFLSVSALPSYTAYAHLWKKIYNSYAKDCIHEFIAPASVEGINFSDHLSFHRNGFPSILISDTGGCRNENYHTERDTEDSINYRFLSENIISISHTVKELSQRRIIP